MPVFTQHWSWWLFTRDMVVQGKMGWSSWKAGEAHWCLHPNDSPACSFKLISFRESSPNNRNPPISCSPVCQSTATVKVRREKSPATSTAPLLRCIFVPLPNPEGYLYFLPYWVVWWLSALIIVGIEKFSGGKASILTEQGYPKFFFY